MADDEKTMSQDAAQRAGRGTDPSTKPDVSADAASNSRGVASGDPQIDDPAVRDQGPAGEQGSE